MKTVVFRTDASTQIGTGHVMRCLALADVLRTEGLGCVFICREHTGHFVDVIRSRGHQVLSLAARRCVSPATSDSKYADWLGTSWEEDARETIAALGARSPAWLVVDHYALDARWERQLRRQCGALMVIDDLADRAHECDLLLDQNLGRSHSDYDDLVPNECNVLAGAMYALLRPEFASIRQSSLSRRSNAGLGQLLISLGGVDQENVTTRVLDALSFSTLPDPCELVILMGAQAPWIKEVRDAAAALRWPAKVHVGADNVATLMSEADLAIGAAGTMAWERCSLGLPSLTLVLADNQVMSARALASSGASISVSASLLPTSLLDALSRAMRPGELQKMQRAAASITDGAGSQRVVAQMRRQHACV